jgi:hypothetical protein
MGLFAANPEPIRHREPSPHSRLKPEHTSGLSRQKRPQPVQQTSQSGYLGRGETVFPVRPAQFIVVPPIDPPKKPARAILHAPLHSPAAAASDASPETPLATATASSQGFLDVRTTCRRFQPLTGRPRLLAMQYPRATEATPQPPDLPTGLKASQPFRTGIVPGTTRKHANGPRLPCRGHRPSSCMVCTTPARLLLRPHSQTSAFDTCPTKGRHRRPSRPLKSFLR